jgi:TonB family protein
MRLVKIIACFVGVLLLSGLVFVGWVYRDVEHPRLPRGWPAGSVWIGSPLLRYALAGSWIGCRLDTLRNIDTCKFANFRGKVWSESDYTTCDEKPPVKDERLLLRPDRQSVDLIWLRDGTLLVNKEECDSRNGFKEEKTGDSGRRRLNYRVRAVYPDRAKTAGIEGDVILNVAIEPDGTISNVVAERGDPTLAQAAIEAVRRWRYDPILPSSRPTETHSTVTVQFRLRPLPSADVPPN